MTDKSSSKSNPFSFFGASGASTATPVATTASKLSIIDDDDDDASFLPTLKKETPKQAPVNPKPTPSKPISIFDEEDDDEDAFVTKSAKNSASQAKKAASKSENPLSFFSFSADEPKSTQPSIKIPPTAKNTASIDLEEDDDFDDDFGASLPSQKPAVISPPTQAAPAAAAPQAATLKTDASVDDDFDDDFDEDIEPNLANGSQKSNNSRTQDSAFACGSDQYKALLKEYEQMKARATRAESNFAKAKEALRKVQANERSEAQALEDAIKLIESNLASQITRAEKAERANAKLQQELMTTKSLLAYFQQQQQQYGSVGGIGHIEWMAVKEKSQFAMSLLKKTAMEAQTGLDLLMRNANVFSELAMMIKDMERIATLADHVQQ